MSSLGIIVARSGSKRLPGKNLKLLAGMPLIAYSVRAAVESQLDRTIISTDSSEIAEVAAHYGAEVLFLRPSALAQDDTSSYEVVKHAVEWLKQHENFSDEIILLLQPTTPFVLPKDINACLAILENDQIVNSCFTLRELEKPPAWLVEMDQKGFIHFEEKKDALYYPSGAVYAMRIAALEAQQKISCIPARGVLMERERSIDIDTETDFLLAEILAERFHFPQCAFSRE